mgnify:CR=1 FL=1
MRDYIYELLNHMGEISLTEIVLHIVVSIVLGLVIYTSYAISHAGSIYSRKFNVSLVALTVLTATVMTVIGNNIALSLGMVGALSIVRFRTAIKDSRDTVYIFWTIIVGICCGVGDYIVAALGSVGVFLVLLLLGCIKNDHRVLLVIRTKRSNEKNVEGAVFDYFERRARLRVKNTTQDSVELIYEISEKLLKKAEVRGSVTDALYQLGDVEYVNLVSQNDEITS